MMNKAQEFLIKKGYSDLVINDKPRVKPDQRVYVSDAMMEFIKTTKVDAQGETQGHYIKKHCPKCNSDWARLESVCPLCGFTQHEVMSV